MRFPRILEQLYGRPWAITADGYSLVRNLVENRIARADNGEDAMDFSGFVNPREPLHIDTDGIAHIDVCGVLGKGLSPIEQSCGNTDYEVIEDEIEQATQAGVKGFFFCIDSPGGMCAGNSEIADMIGRITVPTVAYTDNLACSAAYNIAASCRYIYATQSATVGSIGCIIPWVDQSKMWAGEGIEWAPITNKEGDLKGALQGPSLTEAQRVSLQEYVQDSFELFKSNVLRNRRVPEEAMRGNAFLAGTALKYNLIDSICGEREALARLVDSVRK